MLNATRRRRSLTPLPLAGRGWGGGAPGTEVAAKPPPPPPPPPQRGRGEEGDLMKRASHHLPPSSCRRCNRSYNSNGASSSASNSTAAAEATGQSLLVKNSSHRVWPIISESEPASKSGITNSPTMGMKHSNTPAPTPGSDSGNVTSQNAHCCDEPRSEAASSSAGSILAKVAYSGR